MSRAPFRLSALFVRTRALPATAPGEKVYAIGDVHGRLDLLRCLIKQIEADADTRRKCSTRIVLLGDLIDRGPHSRQVLELAKRMQRHNADRVVVLGGNHEEMLLASAAGNSTAQRLWLKNGGVETLRSYGLAPTEFLGFDPKKRGEVLRQAVGSDTLAWLEALPLVYESGSYFFCHAGVRPGVPLKKQHREDLLWIRRDFLDSDRSHGAVIVHGHSERDEAQVTRNRINVDTAAYRSGQLTAVGLQGPFRWFISTTQRYLHESDLVAATKWALGRRPRPGA